MTKQYKAEDGYRVADLLIGSADHLSAARALYEDDCPEHLDSAGYLAHLGVELLLKAFLLHRNSSFPETHGLADLCGMVAADTPAVKMRKSDSPYRDLVLSLDKCYELRYPNPKGNQGISRGDWKAVKLLVDRLREALPKELTEVFDHPERREKFGRTVTQADKR